ncbi:ABC transporter ATP-binding protein [Halochromatium roseum]|uniref:ABC transporter ATP-binding protein n=1 Tax=Halochromatium roseum TaxID=391920 RepID=UPI0019140D76|nr:ATP-binding cassette domain-containing protein [Halochromatium roseum]MBK5940166.1 ABC transporter ATP-binding protein [Halochromatium roseum]
MSSISVENLTKRFPDGTLALKPTSLTIEDGELFVLVGPSGCGKSTLLKLIVGLEQPSSGEIRLDDERVTGRDPKDRNMAMVFQSYALYPHMSVRDNLAFPLKLAKRDRAEIDRRVEQAAALLELGSMLDRKPAALSGGQRQRVAMGRAIVREPAAFLLDEPLSNLDAKLRGQMRNQLAALQRRLGTTTVYVTHDQTEAMTLGDRIAVLRDGEIQQVGSPQDLYRRPANLFVAGFIGAPAMNLLPARIEGEKLRLPMTTLPIPAGLRDALPANTEAVIAGIRPEHFRSAQLRPESFHPEHLRPANFQRAEDAEAHAKDNERQERGRQKGEPLEGEPLEGELNVCADLVEWLGADLFVHFDVEADCNAVPALQRETTAQQSGDSAGPRRLRVTARIAADTEASDDAEIALAIDPAQLLLFDANSGRRLG